MNAESLTVAQHFTSYAKTNSCRLRLPAAPVASTALHGIQDPPDVSGHLFNPSILFRDLGILLFHPGEDLADVLPVLLQFTPVLCDLVHLPEDDLAQVPDEGGDKADLASEVLNARPHLRKPGRRPVHVVA